MEKLTDRQQDILQIIKKLTAKKGYPPTVREIGEEANLHSPATIHFHLMQLVKKGYISKEDGSNRTIEILVPNEYLDEQEDVVKVPLLGKVTAGTPIEAIEHPDETFALPVELISNKKEVFTLRVSGESMINVGIYDGDILIVERQQSANNGETVVAMNKDNEATVKTFYKENGHIRLQPENDDFDPIIVDDCHIEGLVIGLVRDRI